ncbi:MAG: GAF domain-containing protein, partial [Flavisolibacter sp.]
GFLILKWRTAKLKEKHRELEKTVEERTSQLSQRVAELAVINSVQEGLSKELDMQGIYDLVGDRVQKLFNAQVVVIASFDLDNKMERFNYIFEKGEMHKQEARHINKLRQLLINKKSTIYIPTEEKASKEYGLTAVGGSQMPKSLLFVPLLTGNIIKGYVSLQNIDTENAFSESDIRLLETLANSMSVALENARLFDETTRLLKETEQRTAELSVINSVQEGLAKELHMQAIYELVGDKLSEVMHTLDIDIRLFSPETNQVFYPYMRDHGMRLDIAAGALKGMSKHVYETQQTLIINDNLAGRMEEFSSTPIPGTQMEKSFMAVPIIVGNKALGMVSMSNYEKENAFSDSDVRLLQTVVSAMSVALENARLFDETTRLLKETEQRTAELAVINSVQEGLVREMNTQSIFEMVGDRICSLFPETQTMVIRTFDHEKGLEHWQYAIEKGVRLKNESQPLIWANKQLLVTKKPILINENYIETAKKYGSTGVSKGQPPKSAVFVPMIVGEEVKGSLSLQNVDKENAFSEADIRLLTTVTNSMSVAIENARLFDETTHLLAQAKQRASELGTVNNISKALASKLDADSLIKLVGDQLKDLFRANIVYLALLNKKTNIIYFPYQYGDDMTPMKLGKGLTSNIILKGEPLLLNKDVDETTGQLGLQRIGIPAASYLGVPIPVGDEIIGVLSVQSTEQENRFNENDLRLLSTIASSVGVALKNAQLFDDVQQAKMEAEQASKIAEKANEAKSAFLSTVSHELRTPLTSVLGFAKIIKKRLEEKIFPTIDKTDPKTEKTVEQISENLKVVISEGERLTHLINDVL